VAQQAAAALKEFFSSSSFFLAFSPSAGTHAPFRRRVLAPSCPSSSVRARMKRREGLILPQARSTPAMPSLFLCLVALSAREEGPHRKMVYHCATKKVVRASADTFLHIAQRANRYYKAAKRNCRHSAPPQSRAALRNSEVEVAQAFRERYRCVEEAKWRRRYLFT